MNKIDLPMNKINVWKGLRIPKSVLLDDFGGIGNLYKASFLIVNK